MKRKPISKLFLYRYRFIIGYLLLGLSFIGLLFGLPLLAQTGLSQDEIESATSSYFLGKDGVLNGDLVDLPYRILQKYSIMFLGLSAYSVKLPSMLVGLFLGLLLILLLNRWFKNNVSLLASCLVILSTPFLFLSGSGTPLIMLVFWPTLLLWLGSKIQGERRPRPIFTLVFAITMLASIFTPYMVYFAVFCIIFVLLQPHLRFILKDLPKLFLVVIAILMIGGVTVLGLNIANNTETLSKLLFASGFHSGDFFNNIGAGLALAFSWHNSIESVFLTPLISMPILALALIGLLSTTKGFFASRNSIATVLLVFCIIITGFNPDAIVSLMLPFSILIAHGLKYLLQKWYGLFPENPYARVFALFPLTILFAIIIVPSLLQYIYGYRYTPNVANQFSSSLEIVRKNLSDDYLVVGENYNFYKILENSTNLKVVDKIDGLDSFASLGKLDVPNDNYDISKIITSPMSDNSDIIYIYTFTEKLEGE